MTIPQTVYTTLESPVGLLTLSSAAGALSGVWFDTERHQNDRSGWQRDDAALADAVQQLQQYFAGTRQQFDLPLSPQGTAFQQRVWQALQAIPYGETRSYGVQAQMLGNAKAVRAVGLANGRNPIGIVIPCHRVIGANGALTGYAGGLPRKQWLLAHEAGVARKSLL